MKTQFYSELLSVTFRWGHEVNQSAFLVVLRTDGRVLSRTRMLPLDVYEEQITIDTVFECTLVMAADHEYSYFFEVDEERKYDFLGTCCATEYTTPGLFHCEEDDASHHSSQSIIAN